MKRVFNNNKLSLMNELQRPLSCRLKRSRILILLCALMFSLFELSKIFDFCYQLCTSFLIRLRFYFGSYFAKNHISFKELNRKYTNNFTYNYNFLY